MYNVSEKSIHELKRDLEQGNVTSRNLVLAYMERIKLIDKSEEGLNSVLELNPDALFIADQLDAMRRDGEVLSPLHGIPILLKDNINTGDRMLTTAGAVALADNYAVEDAFITKLLREAGALILGKANMTEYANYMSYNMPGGYSSRGGQVYSPYDRVLNVSGSSSGSAVAVAASLAAVSVGTETSGSILSPACTNGVVGLKPTMGLVSRTGIIPISSTLDTAGPIARSVMDAAILLSVLAAPDQEDPATAQCKKKDYTTYLIDSAVENKRIGICKCDDQCYDEMYNKIADVIKQQGGRYKEIHALDNPTEAGSIMNYEFRSAMRNYLVKYGTAKAKSLSDIIRINQDHHTTNLKYGQLRMMDAENTASGCYIETEYIDLLLRREEYIKNLHQTFIDNDVDAVIIMGKSSIPPYSGFPGITVPLGLDSKGHPVGCCIIAKPFEDGSLMGIAHVLESHLAGRIPPVFNI